MARSSVPIYVEVHGNAVQSLLDALEYLEPKARRILASNGIDPVDPTKWYPLHQLLDSYYDILAMVGPSTVRSIGSHIPQNASFPPNINSFELALSSLNEAYQMNHRGGVGIGGYRYVRESAHGARMVCDNPYPCEFDQGILDALYERFQPKDSVLMRIEHEPGSCRQEGAFTCTYRLRW